MIYIFYCQPFLVYFGSMCSIECTNPYRAEVTNPAINCRASTGRCMMVTKPHSLFWLLSIYTGAGRFRKKEVYIHSTIEFICEIKKKCGNLYLCNIINCFYLFSLESRFKYFRKGFNNNSLVGCFVGYYV